MDVPRVTWTANGEETEFDFKVGVGARQSPAERMG